MQVLLLPEQLYKSNKGDAAPPATPRFQSWGGGEQETDKRDEIIKAYQAHPKPLGCIISGKISSFKGHFPLYNHSQSNSLSLKKLSKEGRDSMKSTEHCLMKKKFNYFLFLFFQIYFKNWRFVAFKFQFATHNAAFPFLLEYLFPRCFQTQCQPFSACLQCLQSLPYLKDILGMCYHFLWRWETKSNSTQLHLHQTKGDEGEGKNP